MLNIILISTSRFDVDKRGNRKALTNVNTNNVSAEYKTSNKNPYGCDSLEKICLMPLVY